MIRTAICDDDADFMENFCKSVDGLVTMTEADMIVESYSDSLDFYEEYLKNPYDIVFLDIEMSGICGFQIVEKLRIVNDKVTIIFVSSHESYVYRSFVFRPFRFIRKNRYKEELYEAFVAALQLYKSNTQILKVTLNGKLIPVRIDDILFFDVYSHNVFLHMGDKKIIVKKSLQDLESELKSVGFIRIHKSYLVNSRHIYYVKSASVILDDHSTLPLSKHRVKEVKDKLMYLSKLSESWV